MLARVTRALDPLKLELWAGWSCLTWVLGFELASSGSPLSSPFPPFLVKSRKKKYSVWSPWGRNKGIGHPSSPSLGFCSERRRGRGCAPLNSAALILWNCRKSLSGRHVHQGARIYLACTCVPRQGRGQSRISNWSLNRKPWRHPVCWLVHKAHASLSHRAQGHLPREWRHPQWPSGPHQSTVKTVPHRHAPRLINLIKTVTQLILFSGDFRLCQVNS